MISVPVTIVFEEAREAGPPSGLVTVAVSLFNYARFLPDCLDSVLAQRHRELELVVVDDVSTKDDSVAIARDWLQAHAGRFERVCLLQHRRNQGLAQARNTAFDHARGSHVFVLDADNEIYPRAILRLRQAIATSGAAAAYTQQEIFGNHHKMGLADIWRPEWLGSGNYVDAMALVSHAAWRDVGGYTHMEGGWEDYDFWCKFIEQGYEATFVPEMLCRYRVHGSSMIRTETARSYEAIFIEMTLRHPWMKLAPIRESDKLA